MGPRYSCLHMEIYLHICIHGEEIHGWDTFIEFTIHSKVEASPGPLGVSGGVGLPGTGECWKLDIPPEHETEKCEYVAGGLGG